LCGPDHSSTLETRGNLARTLVKAGRYDEAMPHLRAVVLRDVPASIRIDLHDPAFDRMRKTQAFRQLEEEVRRRAEVHKSNASRLAAGASR